MDTPTDMNQPTRKTSKDERSTLGNFMTNKLISDYEVQANRGKNGEPLVQK